MEDRETSLFFFEETGRCPRRKESEATEQHIGDVQVVCILCLLALGEGKKEFEKENNLQVEESTGQAASNCK